MPFAMVTVVLVLLALFCSSRAYKAYAERDCWRLHFWSAAFGTFVCAIEPVTPFIRANFNWIDKTYVTPVQMAVSLALALIAFVLHDWCNVHKRPLSAVLGLLLGLSIPAIFQVDGMVRGSIDWVLNLVIQFF